MEILFKENKTSYKNSWSYIFMYVFEPNLQLGV